ncbi:hypothetical protein A3860_35680 [Niastella vici]|uniref:HTH araC/xylS-type domain-containing protein n=1 Tax=Niastella vici TaxID=1703345 RepID=A0A1V9FNL4_9BACT|nr:AraC family transcriptional regulator [Niastella vici]OQP59933.1 hypothetical protein A3860_35680 [Niastella vici]
MPKKDFKREVVTAVVQIKKYIDDHPGTGISTATLASDHNLSRNVLQHAFKKKYHKSIRQYKLEKRMIEALRLIRAGYSIKEVSFKLDYASHSSFSNAFRKYYDISASEWLQEMKSNVNKQGKM